MKVFRRICSGLKRCDGQLSTAPARRRETEQNIFSWAPAPTWPELGTQSSGAAGEIDPITSAEGKVSILNDSLTTNKGRTLPGPQPLRAQFVLTLATAEARQ